MTKVAGPLNRTDVAKVVADRKDSILKDWEEKCRQRVDAAKVQSAAALRDSLPEFIDQLAETLIHGRSEAGTNAEVAKEHAEDRSNQSAYTLDQVIVEYHILRQVVIKFIEAAGNTDSETLKIVHDFIDRGVATASRKYIEIEMERQDRQNSEIEATRLEAEKASQAKSAFLANMSHEIRSPLGAIMGFVGLLKDGGLSNEDSTNYLSVIDRNSHHLLRIIDDILDLTKVEAGKMTIEKIEFSLFEFLADFSSLAALRARENGIGFDFRSDDLLPEHVVTDPTRLRQILSNVVGNAIKFTEKGHVDVLVTYREGRLGFKVTDTGRGISEEQRLHLFQAFSQADSSTTRKFGGTGLGLILTQKLSKAMDGDFRLVQSELGKGSIFEVAIPVSIAAEGNLVPLTVPQQKVLVEPAVTKLSGFKVLLVEDSPDNQYLIEKMLNRTGAMVTIASDGAEGVKLALSKTFDVVLMDIQMPVMDGHEAIRALLAKGYKTPIVALTAHAMKEEKDRAISSGFSYFLTKPIDRKSLLDLLRKLYDAANLSI